MKAPGVAFKQAVADIVAEAGCKTMDGRVALYAVIYPKDRRRQDLDNRSKLLCDALTSAGVWNDDSQIDELTLVRRGPVPGGMVKVVITEVQNV
jgi:crossover junction endodeoxyribonuclease RusA